MRWAPWFDWFRAVLCIVIAIGSEAASLEKHDQSDIFYIKHLRGSIDSPAFGFERFDCTMISPPAISFRKRSTGTAPATT